MYIISVYKHKGLEMRNIYTESTKLNLEKLLEDGCQLGVLNKTKDSVLRSNFLAVNSFGIICSFNDENRCKRLKLKKVYFS